MRNDDEIKVLYGLYTGLILFWIWVAWITGMMKMSIASVLLFTFPILMFLLAMWSADKETEKSSEHFFRENRLALGLVIIGPILALFGKGYTGCPRLFAMAVMISIVLNLASLIDIWVPDDYVYLLRHIKSALQTMSITMIVYAIYLVMIGCEGKYFAHA